MIQMVTVLQVVLQQPYRDIKMDKFIVEDTKANALIKMNELVDSINDYEKSKSELARQIGGTAYQTILGFPLTPSLDWKSFDYKDKVNGAPPESTFTRASSATFINAVGEIETVGNDVLRHDYDPVTGEYLGWLIEEERENKLQYSNDFNDQAWSKSGASTIPNSTFSPSGENNADKLVEDESLNFHGVTQVVVFDALKKVSIQLYVKPSGRTKFAFRCSDPSFIGRAFFDLSNETTAKDDSIEKSSITSLPNGWYLCSATFETGTSGTTASVQVQLQDDNGDLTYNGNGSSGVYLWGAQLEEGSFPTSYIPTTATVETREADDFSVSTSDFPYNQKEGTLYSESGIDVDTGISNNFILSLSDTPSLNYIRMNKDGAGGLRTSVRSDGIIVAAPYILGFEYSTMYKFASSYQQDSYSTVTNGGEVISDTSGDLPLAADNLFIGSVFSGGGLLNGHIRQVTYFPKRLSDENLQKLTR